MELYWIAINGSSCAICGFPLKNPAVAPVPEVLFGFKTFEEASEAQRTCLHEPIIKVKTAMREWIAREDVNHIRPENPGQMTDGPTIWGEKEDGIV